MGTGGDIGSATFLGFVELSAGEVLAIEVNTVSGANKTITLRDATFGCRRIG